MNSRGNPFDARHLQIAILFVALVVAAAFLIWLSETQKTPKAPANESAENVPWPIIKPVNVSSNEPSPQQDSLPRVYPSLLKGKINLYGEFWCNLASAGKAEGIAGELRPNAGNTTAGIVFAAFDWMQGNLNATQEHYGSVKAPKVVLETKQANLEDQAVFGAALAKAMGAKTAFLLSADCGHAFAGIRAGDAREYAVLRQSISQGYSLSNASFYSIKDDNGTVWMAFDPLFSQYPGDVFEGCKRVSDIFLAQEC